MTRKAPRRGRMIPVLFFTFAAGLIAGWSVRGPVTSSVLQRAGDVSLVRGTGGAVPIDAAPPERPATGEAAVAPAVIAAPTGSNPIAALAARHLRLPVDDANIDAMKGQFADRRARGARGHEAVDILAPRNTPVHAVEDGTIAKLFVSKQGGITVYQFEPSGRFCYYYAHLERYAENLHEGHTVSRGQVIGYVGTSGNAPPGTPHLHFAIFELTPDRHWWEGTPLDPWAVFAR
jgi:peptidoglycan LD-endopeptidase LytH